MYTITFIIAKGTHEWLEKNRCSARSHKTRSQNIHKCPCSTKYILLDVNMATYITYCIEWNKVICTAADSGKNWRGEWNPIKKYLPIVTKMEQALQYGGTAKGDFLVWWYHDDLHHSHQARLYIRHWIRWETNKNIATRSTRTKTHV